MLKDKHCSYHELMAFLLGYLSLDRLSVSLNRKTVINVK
jgi:hypothetical protein